MHMFQYIYVSTIVFWFLFLIWNKADWKNFFIKALFLILALWGTLISLSHLGYLIKIGA